MRRAGRNFALFISRQSIIRTNIGARLRERIALSSLLVIARCLRQAPAGDRIIHASKRGFLEEITGRYYNGQPPDAAAGEAIIRLARLA